MLGFLSLDIMCYSKLTVFLELCSRKTVRVSEQIMSSDKYSSIFSHQMEAIVFFFFFFFFSWAEVTNQKARSSFPEAQYLLITDMNRITLCVLLSRTKFIQNENHQKINKKWKYFALAISCPFGKKKKKIFMRCACTCFLNVRSFITHYTPVWFDSRLSPTNFYNFQRMQQNHLLSLPLSQGSWDNWLGKRP